LMRVEVLGGVERRRRWSRDDKMRIIEETLGLSPDGPASGPFPTSFSAYRQAMNTAPCSSFAMRGAPKIDPQR
jgi:hypothetical protein